MTWQIYRHASSPRPDVDSGEELSTNERLAGGIGLLIVVEFVLSLIMLSLEWVVAANPAGPFGKGHLYEPIFIGLLTFFSLVVRFACAVSWCWWSARIMSVVRDNGAVRLRRATPWSLVWWFVPGFNFVMPYLATRELWKAAVAASEGRIDEWSSVRVPVFLHVWWAFWTINLLAYILLIGLSAAYSYIPTPESTMLRLFMVRDVALLVAAPLAIALIVKFNRLVGDPDREDLTG
jgi:hypothetical protein